MGTSMHENSKQTVFIPFDFSETLIILSDKVSFDDNDYIDVKGEISNEVFKVSGSRLLNEGDIVSLH